MSFNVKSLPEFDQHQSIIRLDDKKSGLSGWIAIHRGSIKKPAFGATRLWHYRNQLEPLKDVLRLSKMMSYKAAIADLPYGGAKAVILENNHNSDKSRVLKGYTKAINQLKGLFITGSDVGLSLADVKLMKRFSPYIVGIKNDPTYFTALGLRYAL